MSAGRVGRVALGAVAPVAVEAGGDARGRDDFGDRTVRHSRRGEHHERSGMAGRVEGQRLPSAPPWRGTNTASPKRAPSRVRHRRSPRAAS